MVRAKLLGERPKGKYSPAEQLNGQEGLKLYYYWENAIFSNESIL